MIRKRLKMSGTSKSKPLPESDSDSAPGGDLFDHIWRKAENIREIFNQSKIYEPKHIPSVMYL